MIEFYEFSTNLSAISYKASPRDLKSYVNAKSDWWHLARGDFDNMAFPIIFDHFQGKKLRDVMETGTAVLYLISDNMKGVLELNHLTGWTTFPVKIFDKKGSLVEGYHGFSIIGRSGPIDYGKSKIIHKQLVPGGRTTKYYVGQYIDPATWDKSDFFMAEGLGSTFLSSKAADILIKSKLTNIELTKASEIELPEFYFSKNSIDKK